MAINTKIFFDTEFTGLQQDTTLISIGLVTENDKGFYAEFTDYNEFQVNDWIRSNVIDNLYCNKDDDGCFKKPPVDFEKFVIGNKIDIRTTLLSWLQQFDNIEIWSDCLAYDWMLFCDLVGGSALNIPKNIYYIPFDICTLFKIKGIDPDISREAFCDVNNTEVKHNALWDATIIKSCYEKLMLLK